MKKLIMLVFLLMACNLISASTQSFYFDTVSNSTAPDRGVIHSKDLVLEIRTGSNQLCRYGESEGDYFNSMSSFGENLYTYHKKEFVNLNNGVYTYYIKCRPIDDINNASFGVNWLKINFKISNLIAASIVMEDSPLTEGKYEIDLTTTKVPLTIPKLSYSFDGISYSPIVLNGNGRNWKGYLIVSTLFQEKIGSFKFEAKDLENRVGTDIYGVSVFEIDTKPPRAINSISAIGEYGDISLEWYLEEDEGDIEFINIYRSKSPNVDLTDFYKSIDEDLEYYTDNSVDNGETYYYRIASEDAAGNIASLSREMKATALQGEISSTSTGLAPELWGKVDSLLVEIELLQSEIDLSESNVNNGKNEEDTKLMGITEDLKSSKLELSSLKRTVENLKTQGLTEQVLDSKISSSRVKMDIIRKKVPESFSITESSQQNQEISEEGIRTAILEKSPELSYSLVDKGVKDSKKMIEDYGLKISGEIKVFEIIYLDGSKKYKTSFKYSIDSTLEDQENLIFLMKLPLGTLDSNSIKIHKGDYTPEKESLISFKKDTNEIVFTTDERLNVQTLESITISPALIIDESTQLTGFFLSEISSSGSIGTALLIILILGLLTYLFYMRKTKRKVAVPNFIEKAKKIKNLHKEGNHEEASSLYENLQSEYLGLSEKEKKKVFKEVKHLTK